MASTRKSNITLMFWKPLSGKVYIDDIDFDIVRGIAHVFGGDGDVVTVESSEGVGYFTLNKPIAVERVKEEDVDFGEDEEPSQHDGGGHGAHHARGGGHSGGKSHGHHHDDDDWGEDEEDEEDEEEGGIMGMLSQWWPGLIVLVVAILGIFVIWKNPEVVTNFKVSFQTASTSVLVFLFVTALVNAVQSLMQGEWGWLEDLWTPIALVLTSVGVQYLDKQVLEPYILKLPVQEMIDMIRMYDRAVNTIQGGLLILFIRAVTVQRTMRRLDMSPAIVLSVWMLAFIHQTWIVASSAGVSFYILLLVVSIIIEAFKKSLFNEPIWGRRSTWMMIGLFSGVVMIAVDGMAIYLVMFIMVILVVGTGYAVTEKVRREIPHTNEMLRIGELTPWIAFEVMMIVWYFGPRVWIWISAFAPHLK